MCNHVSNKQVKLEALDFFEKNKLTKLENSNSYESDCVINILTVIGST